MAAILRLPLYLATIFGMFGLTGCYEPSSTWSEKQGRFRPTDEVRREIINEEIDKREAERLRRDER